jgi:hypothetical protein
MNCEASTVGRPSGRQGLCAISLAALALALGLAFMAINRQAPHAPPQTAASQPAFSGVADGQLLVPVILLDLADDTRESAWSAALAKIVDGKTEVKIANGRIDVLNAVYAIEVDRLGKWHEGIGQAAHYGVETGKRPCVALMIDKGLWPLAPATVEKLRTIEKTALAQGITLVLLRNGR